jgi:hypothetical protein
VVARSLLTLPSIPSRAVSDCQSKRHKHASLSQGKHAAAREQENSAEGDEEEGGSVVAAAAASSPRRPPRRAAAEAVQKLHAQFAMGKRRRSRSLSEKRKESSADSDASEVEDNGAALATARIIRRNGKRGASAASASTASNRTHDARKHHPREMRLRDEDDSEPSEEGSSSSDELEERDSGNSAELSELSDDEEDEEMAAWADEMLSEYALVADDAEEWTPGAAASSSSTRGRKRKVNRPLPSLLKISPLNAVRRFIVEEMDSQKSSSYVGPHILRAVVETMDAHKSVEPRTQVWASTCATDGTASDQFLWLLLFVPVWLVCSTCSLSALAPRCCNS